jgi:pimeloyl-ACP methyl ester carboxylesterase
MPEAGITTESLFWLIGLTVVLVAVAGFFLLRSRSRANAAISAALEAQMGRDADELDLDRRLGLRKFFDIESVGSESLSLAYRQTGSGTDILCLHGIGASMIIYRRLVPWLANDHRVTCLDFPGFGASSKPRTLSYSLDEQAEHLGRAMKALNLDQPLVVASSMGAAIALATATRLPDLFRGVVALGPAVDPSRIPTTLLPLAKHADRLHRINSLATVKAVVQQVISRRELITPALVALYQEPFRDSGDSSSAFMKAFSLLADRRMPRLFSELETPVLIVRGLRDRLVKQAACEDLHRLVKSSKLITHPTAGHHIMEDEPEFTAIEIRKFDATLV